MFGLFGKRSGKAIKSTRPEPAYEMYDDPVIGYVLLSESVSRDQIINALNDHVSEDDQLEWDEDAADEDSLGCSINGLWISISLTDAPFPDGEAQGVLHPVFGGDDPESIEQHRAFLIVAGVPALSKGHSGGEAPFSHKDAVILQVQAVRSLLLLPEAVGYYSGGVGTTYSKEAYLTITDAENPMPAAFIGPVWVRPGEDDTWNAYSIGLPKWGIPDIQVVGSKREPSELFGYLTDIVDYQIRGGRIRAGETLGRDENEKIMTSWQPSIVDEGQTALQLEM